MVDYDDDSDEEDGKAVPPIELAKSYLAYIKRSITRHKLLLGLVSGALVVLTIIGVSVWPRTYTSTTVLAAKDNRVLDGDKSSDAFRGAEEIIRSRENIAVLVKQVELTKRWDKTQPPATRLKQAVMRLIRGEMSEADKRDALISMVQNAITVIPPGWGQSKLIVSVDWNDPELAADLADAAEQSFLRARQVAEVSTISEYIAILEGHAKELNSEIKKLASESQSARDDKLAQAQQLLTPAQGASAEKDTQPVQRARVAPAAPRKPVEDLSELRAELESKERALKALEDTRRQRLADAQATLTGLRSTFTAAHPMVIAAENNVASLSQDSPQLATLRSDIAALNSTLKSKTAAQELAAAGGPRVSSVPNSSGTPGASGVEPLPAEVMRLMQEGNEELDPAVAAQFRGAVAKYAAIRDKIGTARVDLDTAQAAFKHRYQIVIPAEAPSKPSKPKVPLVLAAGVLVSLLVGLIATILAELRTGRVVERWQVYRLGVPLLGEVRWPPTSES